MLQPWYFGKARKLLCTGKTSSMTIRGHASSALILASLTCLLLSASTGFAQGPTIGPGQGRLTLSEVVDRLTEKNAERAQALEQYRSRRSYELDYTGFPKNMHAEMVVDMVYSAPATEKFTVVSQSGPKWMVNLVIKRLMETEQESIDDKNRPGVQITSRNYNFTLLESKDTGDGCSYVLGVEPKIPNKFLFRGRIWVDDRDFAVCRIEAEPAKNPSFWIKKTEIHHSFAKVGDFWLPAENKSVSHVRLDGHATLTIKYGDYEIEAAHALAMTDPDPTPN
jgi:hypothetical protein